MALPALREAVLQDGKTGERDIYVYREGFYRGIWVLFILVTFALFALEMRRSVSKAAHRLSPIGTSANQSWSSSPFSPPPAFTWRFNGSFVSESTG